MDAVYLVALLLLLLELAQLVALLVGRVGLVAGLQRDAHRLAEHHLARLHLAADALGQRPPLDGLPLQQVLLAPLLQSPDLFQRCHLVNKPLPTTILGPSWTQSLGKQLVNR